MAAEAPKMEAESAGTAAGDGVKTLCLPLPSHPHSHMATGREVAAEAAKAAEGEAAEAVGAAATEAANAEAAEAVTTEAA